MFSHYDISLSENERSLLDVAANFARDYVAKNAAQWEQERRLPIEAIKEAAKLGLTGIETPLALGGQDCRFVAKLLIAEALSAHCMAFAFSLINTQNVAARLATSGTQDQVERFLPDLLSGERMGASALTEPGAGSDFAAIQMRATKVEDGWSLDGEKAWITNAACADIFVVYAQTDPEKKWRGIASYLVDARQPGFERGEPYDLLGGHAIGAGGFRLSNFFVADKDLIAGPGDAFKNALSGINGARTYVAGMCNAMVHSSLQHALEFGEKREVFDKSLVQHQGLRWKLSDIATNLEASRLLTYKAAQLVQDEGDAMLAASYAKKFSVETAQNNIAQCIQFMGAEGLRSHHPLGRHLACAKLAAYTDGSTEMQNERIGANLVEKFSVKP